LLFQFATGCKICNLGARPTQDWKFGCAAKVRQKLCASADASPVAG
jgi:hypothetical protein